MMDKIWFYLNKFYEKKGKKDTLECSLECKQGSNFVQSKLFLFYSFFKYFNEIQYSH